MESQGSCEPGRLSCRLNRFTCVIPLARAFALFHFILFLAETRCASLAGLYLLCRHRLELPAVLLPQPSECGGYRCALPDPLWLHLYCSLIKVNTCLWSNNLWFRIDSCSSVCRQRLAHLSTMDTLSAKSGTFPPPPTAAQSLVLADVQQISELVTDVLLKTFISHKVTRHCALSINVSNQWTVQSTLLLNKLK